MELTRKICGCPIDVDKVTITKYIKYNNLRDIVIYQIKKHCQYLDLVHCLLPVTIKLKLNRFKKEIKALSMFNSCSICECLGCGFINISPLPSEEMLFEYYSSNTYYDNKGVELLPKKLKVLRKERHDYQLDLLMKYINLSNINTVLDFGAGIALFPYLLRKKNPEIVIDLVEPDREFKKIHDNRLKTHCYEKISKIPSGKKYTLIYASHSLEHVIDPIKTLKFFNLAIENDGLLFIEVPNAGQEFFDNYRTDAPHISFFNIDSLTRIAEKTGFKVIHIEEYGLKFQLYNQRKNFTDDYIEQQRKYGWSIRAVFKKI